MSDVSFEAEEPRHACGDRNPLITDTSPLLGPFSAERDRRQRKLEKHRFAGELHVTALYNPPLGNWGGYLTIRGASWLFPPFDRASWLNASNVVVQARKLLAKDSGGTSDPYVALSMNGKRYSCCISPV
jgi:hypothetical protein